VAEELNLIVPVTPCAMKIPSGFAATLLCPVALASQKVLTGHHDHNPLDDAFERFALETLDEFHVPGLAIAIVDGENTWAAVS